MEASTLVRLGFIAGAVGGALFVASNVFLLGADYDNFAEMLQTRSFTMHTILFWLASVLFLLALVALYAVQTTEAGVVGFVGFLVAFVGTAFALAVTWSETFALAVLADEAPELVDDPPARVAAGLSIAFPLFVIGWLLFAGASVRARVLPRRPAIALLAGVVATVPAFAIPGLGGLFGLGIIWLAVASYSAGVWRRGAAAG